MLEHLDVPFRDASATQLVWQLDAEPQPFLARRRARLGPWHLELRLLGASHQVLVEDRTGRVRCSELVACRPGAAGRLPAAIEHRAEGISYRFASTITQVDATALAEEAGRLRRADGTDGVTLVGAFPGSPHAVTAIEVTPTGWRTWHVYPQTGEVVATETSLATGADPGVGALVAGARP